jgi:hypothetical protein
MESRGPTKTRELPGFYEGYLFVTVSFGNAGLTDISPENENTVCPRKCTPSWYRLVQWGDSSVTFTLLVDDNVPCTTHGMRNTTG